MKRVLCLLVLLACVSTAWAKERPSLSPKPIVTYDRFKDVTIVRSGEGALPGNTGALFRLEYEYSGTTPRRPETISLVYTKISKGFTQENTTEVNLLGGNARFSVPVNYSFKRTNYFVLETLKGFTTTSNIELLRGTGFIEMRVGRDEYRLNGEVIQEFIASIPKGAENNK